MSDDNRGDAATKTYRCQICSRPADGLLCDRCREEVDRGDYGRIDEILGGEAKGASRWDGRTDRA